ncbi:MAG TPA: PhoH family protein [Methanosarcina sp.]|nr:PhoH family protein [Methanosarcina sp.]
MADNNALYKLALRDKKFYPVIAYGSAGTGKTYGAVEAAYEGITHNKYQQIIVTRPNVSFADTNGFLPGTEREKMEPWVRPIFQHLNTFCPSYVSDKWERDGKLLFYPLEFIQGMTFDNSFIIVDECQNITFDQLKVLLTRTGKYSKLVLCGDIAQVSPKFANSGLAELIRMVEYLDMPVHRIEFTHEDILRSEQCKQWIKAFENWEIVNAVRS